MKKLFLYTSALLVSAAIFAGAEQVFAGDCYADPVYERNATGKVVVGARVRSGACMEGTETLATVAAGETVTIIGETDGWYKVRTSSGVEGWSGATLISVSGDTGVKEKVRETAKEKKEEYSTRSEEAKAELRERLKGKILLDVENKGEAWYVKPDDGSRLYLKDGDTAYELMRSLGLGVTNADFDRIEARNAALLERLKGKIILLVQKRGEAYYINPTDKSVHYLKDGKEAYRIMRELSLGIKASDLKDIVKKELKEIKKEEKSEKTEAMKAEKEAMKAEKEAKKAELLTEDADGVITLSGEGVGGKAFLKWTVENMDVSGGFKVVTSESANPTYPGSSAQYVGAGDRAFTWKELKARTYHFRVCRYNGNGGCTNYSNDLELTIPAAETSEASSSNGSITLQATLNAEGKAILTWSLKDMESDMGFKVVTSTSENPVYPGNDYHYLSDSETRSDTWSGLKAGKTYHFRVCEYLGGRCGVYSNNVKISL